MFDNTDVMRGVAENAWLQAKAAGAGKKSASWAVENIKGSMGISNAFLDAQAQKLEAHEGELEAALELFRENQAPPRARAGARPGRPAARSR